MLAMAPLRIVEGFEWTIFGFTRDVVLELDGDVRRRGILLRTHVRIRMHGTSLRTSGDASIKYYGDTVRCWVFLLWEEGTAVERQEHRGTKNPLLEKCERDSLNVKHGLQAMKIRTSTK